MGVPLYGPNEVDVYEVAMDLVDAGELVAILNRSDRLCVRRYFVAPKDEAVVFAADPDIRLRCHAALMVYSS